MDTPSKSTDCARPLQHWYDDTIIEVARIARSAAKRWARPDLADDVAGDVVLSLLQKFASGRVTEPPRYLNALVARLVRQRTIDYVRRDRTRTTRESDYGRAHLVVPHPWMQPDISEEEQELTDLKTRMLAELPETRRQVFLLVRDGQMTYRVAGEQLGLTPLAICAHVVAAQRTFRRRLTAHGIECRTRRAFTHR